MPKHRIDQPYLHPSRTVPYTKRDEYDLRLRGNRYFVARDLTELYTTTNSSPVSREPFLPVTLGSSVGKGEKVQNFDLRQTLGGGADLPEVLSDRTLPKFY